jgi:hypothetical protein
LESSASELPALIAGCQIPYSVSLIDYKKGKGRFLDVQPLIHAKYSESIVDRQAMSRVLQTLDRQRIVE